MSWVAVAAAGATIVGGLIQSRGAKDAAEASARGSDRAIDVQNQQFNLIRSDLTPAIQLGHSAIGRLNRLYGYNPQPLAAGVSSSSGAVAPSADGRAADGTRGIIQGTDPLGLYSGGSVNARRILDPFGLTGGGGGDTERFNAAPRPEGVGPTRFKPSDVVRRLQQGMSIEDILKAGYLSPLEGDPNDKGDKEIRYLQESGFTSEQIGQLMGRGTSIKGSPPGGALIDGTTGQVIEEGKPDMSAFFESPDYQFNLAEGQKAIDRSLASRGRALSGAGVREGTRYASGMASNEFSAFVNRLMAQAGLAQTATNTGAAVGMNAASNIGNAAMNAGNARASGYLNSSGAIAGAVRGGAQDILLAQYLRPNAGGGAPAAATGYWDPRWGENVYGI